MFILFILLQLFYRGGEGIPNPLSANDTLPSIRGGGGPVCCQLTFLGKKCSNTFARVHFGDKNTSKTVFLSKKCLLHRKRTIPPVR